MKTCLWKRIINKIIEVNIPVVDIWQVWQWLVSPSLPHNYCYTGRKTLFPGLYPPVYARTIGTSLGVTGCIREYAGIPEYVLYTSRIRPHNGTSLGICGRIQSRKQCFSSSETLTWTTLMQISPPISTTLINGSMKAIWQSILKKPKSCTSTPQGKTSHHQPQSTYPIRPFNARSHINIWVSC